MAEDVQDRLNRYLQDTIALESSLVTGLEDMAGDAIHDEDRVMFETHKGETQTQYNRLVARLEARGGSVNSLKAFVNNIGIAATDLLHAGKNAEDKAARNLIQAYAIENLEVATYEALYAAAKTAGDMETAQLARDIQKEEQTAADKVFARIKSQSSEAAAMGDRVTATV